MRYKCTRAPCERVCHITQLYDSDHCKCVRFLSLSFLVQLSGKRWMRLKKESSLLRTMCSRYNDNYYDCRMFYNRPMWIIWWEICTYVSGYFNNGYAIIGVAMLQVHAHALLALIILSIFHSCAYTLHPHTLTLTHTHAHTHTLTLTHTHTHSHTHTRCTPPVRMHRTLWRWWHHRNGPSPTRERRRHFLS
jgi:hypothetical protein